MATSSARSTSATAVFGLFEADRDRRPRGRDDQHYVLTARDAVARHRGGEVVRVGGGKREIRRHDRQFRGGVAGLEGHFVLEVRIAQPGVFLGDGHRRDQRLRRVALPRQGEEEVLQPRADAVVLRLDGDRHGLIRAPNRPWAVAFVVGCAHLHFVGLARIDRRDGRARRADDVLRDVRPLSSRPPRGTGRRSPRWQGAPVVRRRRPRHLQAGGSGARHRHLQRRIRRLGHVRDAHRHRDLRRVRSLPAIVSNHDDAVHMYRQLLVVKDALRSRRWSAVGPSPN